MGVIFYTKLFLNFFPPELLIQKKGREKGPVIKLHHPSNPNMLHNEVTGKLTSYSPGATLSEQRSCNSTLKISLIHNSFSFKDIFWELPCWFSG